MDEFLVLLVGGVPIALGVLLGVQGLKVFKFVDGESAPKAAIAIAAVLGVFSLAGEMFPIILPYAEKVYIHYIGVMSGGLFYSYLAAPFLEKLGVSVRSENL